MCNLLLLEAVFGHGVVANIQPHFLSHIIYYIIYHIFKDEGVYTLPQIYTGEGVHTLPKIYTGEGVHTLLLSHTHTLTHTHTPHTHTHTHTHSLCAASVMPLEVYTPHCATTTEPQHTTHNTHSDRQPEVEARALCQQETRVQMELLHADLSASLAHFMAPAYCPAAGLAV